MPIKHWMHKCSLCGQLPWLKSENICCARCIMYYLKIVVIYGKALLCFLFSPIYFKYAGHRRKRHPDRLAKVHHGHLCHQQRERRHWTLWWHWNFWRDYRRDHPGQHWICSPGLRIDDWSDPWIEPGLPQPKELRHYYEFIQKVLMRMDGEKLPPKSPWPEEQNRCWTVGIHQSHLATH